MQLAKKEKYNTTKLNKYLKSRYILYLKILLTLIVWVAVLKRLPIALFKGRVPKFKTSFFVVIVFQGFFLKFLIKF